MYTEFFCPETAHNFYNDVTILEIEVMYIFLDFFFKKTINMYLRLEMRVVWGLISL